MDKSECMISVLDQQYDDNVMINSMIHSKIMSELVSYRKF